MSKYFRICSMLNNQLTVSVNTNLWKNGVLNNRLRDLWKCSSKLLFTSWYSAIQFGLDLRMLMIFSIKTTWRGLNCAKNRGKCINWPAIFVPSTLCVNDWHLIKLWRSNFFLWIKRWTCAIYQIFNSVINSVHSRKVYYSLLIVKCNWIAANIR